MKISVSLCFLFGLGTLSVAWGKGGLRNDEGASLLQRSRRTKKTTSSIVKYMSRHLEETNTTTVSEFCDDMTAMEEYLLEQFLQVTEAFPKTVLTESGHYVCSCQEADAAFALKCGLLNTWQAGDELLNNQLPLQVNYEEVQFVIDEAIGGPNRYLPVQLKWCDTGDFSEYCETMRLFPKDPTQVFSCKVEDSTCDQNATCVVCADGQTYAVTNPCYPFDDTNCADEGSAAFLYNENFLQDLTSIDKDPEPKTDGCSSDLPSVEDFCEDLSAMESNMTNAFNQYFSTEMTLLGNNVTGYNCSCIREEEEPAPQRKLQVATCAEQAPFDCPEGTYCTQWTDGCNDCGCNEAAPIAFCTLAFCPCMEDQSCKAACKDNDACVPKGNEELPEVTNNATDVNATMAPPLTVRCEGMYYHNNFPDDILKDSTDMVFAPSREDTNVLVPSTITWTDQPVNGDEILWYETYELAIGQDELSSCDINGCQADFCEVCSNGMAVASNCELGTYCPTFETGAYLLSYRNTRLAIETCSGNVTDEGAGPENGDTAVEKAGP